MHSGGFQIQLEQASKCNDAAGDETSGTKNYRVTDVRVQGKEGFEGFERDQQKREEKQDTKCR